MTVSKVHASMEIWGWPPRLGDRKPGIHQFHEGERTAQCPMVFKAAILLLYARIFSIEERVSKSIRILIWLLLITLLPVQSLKLAVCKPIPAYWELSNSLEEQARYCRQDQQSVFKADITIAIITDLLILIIPVPLTIPLSFPIRKKIRILRSLLSGSSAVCVAIYKGTLIFHPGGNDATFNIAILFILT